MPKRIQRRRTKGWRMPEGAVYVGRPSKWGNLHRIRPHALSRDVVDDYLRWLETSLPGQELKEQAKTELRGKDLACWCPLSQKCHADVLLEIANS